MRPRTLLFVVLAAWALVPGWTGDERLALLDRPLSVTVTPVGVEGQARAGRLTFVDGIALASAAKAFGGFSALAVGGGRVTLMSDGGNLVSFRWTGGARIADLRAGELPAGPGTGWRKNQRDSEGLAVDPATGTAWVAFERANGIWRYAPGFARGTGWVRPAAMRRWRSNGGAETLVRLRDGRFVAMQEETRGGRPRAVLVWADDPLRGGEPVRLAYRPPAGFDPVDAAELPDGRLLVLSRWWGLPLRFESALEIVDLRRAMPGAVLTGKPVARLRWGNLEGVAVTRDRRGMLVWLVSDNDRMVLRRSLLLRYRLD
jgi:hypothetical protein